MKLTQFKKVIKEVMRDVIREELKEILLEAVKAPKTITTQPIRESYNPPPTEHSPPFNPVASPTLLTQEDRRKAYDNILNETQQQMSPQPKQSFTPNPNVDVMNGILPEGEVSLGQITSLLK